MGVAASSDLPIKPIYIYPGLLRRMRDKALALDRRCPATIYKCAGCKAEGVEDGGECVHGNACAVCLDEFHTKDLVRRMPCSAHHVFHSRCILAWFAEHERCPLCNEHVAENATPTKRRTSSMFASRRVSDVAPPENEPQRERGATLRRFNSLSFTRRTRSSNSAARSDSTAGASDSAQDVEISLLQKSAAGQPPRTYSYIVHDSVRMEMEK